MPFECRIIPDYAVRNFWDSRSGSPIIRNLVPVRIRVRPDGHGANERAVWSVLKKRHFAVKKKNPGFLRCMDGDGM